MTLLACSGTSGDLLRYLNAVFNGEQEKINPLFLCEEGIEKSVPCAHRLSSRGKSREAKW